MYKLGIEIFQRWGVLDNFDFFSLKSLMKSQGWTHDLLRGKKARKIHNLIPNVSK